MSALFTKYFNVKAEELRLVYLLIIQSLCIGVFNIAYDIGAHTIFLDRFSADMIPQAYILSGAAGVLITFIYTRLQERIRFATLVLGTTGFIAICTAVLRIGFQFITEDWLVFTVFIMLGPLTIISLVAFWGTVSRLFNIRQGKRLFGLIDSGKIFGSIVVSFTIPLILSAVVETENLLYLSTASLVVAFIVQLVILRENDIERKDLNEEKVSTFKEISSNRYTLMMALFVVFSMVGAFFIAYVFLDVAKVKYPEERNFAEFLGVFTGLVMICTFLVKTFVLDKMLKNYGLKVTLLILPILLIAFGVVTSGAGLALGAESETEGFTIFFILVAMCRFLSLTVRESVELPAFKLLYQSLAEKIRYRVQAYIDGTVNEFAALFSGLFLAALGLISFFETVHFVFFMTAITVGWFLISRRLNVEYKRSLERSLAGHEKETDLDLASIEQVRSHSEVVADLSARKLVGLSFCESQLLAYVRSNNPQHRQGAVEFLNEQPQSFGELIIERMEANGVEDTVFNLVREAVQASKAKATTQSSVVKGKLETLNEITSKKSYAKNAQQLNALIRDNAAEVKLRALQVAGASGLMELAPLMCEALSNPILKRTAYEALVEMGEPALDALDQYFKKTMVRQEVQMLILSAYGEIGGTKTAEILLSLLNHPNKQIKTKVVRMLSQIGYTSDASTFTRILQDLDERISVIGWNISIHLSIGNQNDFLAELLEKEINKGYDSIFKLLSLAYDSTSVGIVRENFESDSAEGKAYAIELLDLFIEEDLKNKLYPVLEDINYTDVVRQLSDHYPLFVTNYEDALKRILTRDVNQISPFTQAVAIYAHLELEDARLSDDLIAHLFNPNQHMSETATYVINKINRPTLLDLLERLEPKVKTRLEYLLEMSSRDQKNLLVEKATFLHSETPLDGVECNIIFDIAALLNQDASGGQVVLKDSNGLPTYYADAKAFESTMFNNEETLEFLKNLETHRILETA